jgi:hypothetical protein
MFLASSAKPIDPQMQKWVDEIEAPRPGFSVLAARQFRYSLHQTPVEVTISEPRKFNVLEEFVLRAGIELNPPPTEDELAAVLGLDPVFVRSTTAALRMLQTLTRASRITVTPQGRKFYEQGTVPQPPYHVQIYAIADPLDGNLAFGSSPLNEALVNLPDLADFVTIENRIPVVSSLELDELQQLVQVSSLGLHVPESGKLVTSYRVAAPTQTIWKTMSLFVLFDVLEDKVQLQVRRGKQILEEASNWLEALQAEGKVSLKALCELSEEIIAVDREASLNQKNAEVEARLEKIRQQALETARLQSQQPQADSPEAATVVQLRDREIHQAFLDVLNSAHQQILIYSPWVSGEVVDDKFLTLLQNLANHGVWILIGHGISRRQEDENQPIPPELEEKLRTIKTPEGLPAVQVFWLGYSHAKEIVVDRKVYLCGSHNWFSYHGDWVPLGETVYQVTVPDQVQAVYDFLAGRFQTHAQKLWDAAVIERDSIQAEVPLCIWGALGMEEEALNQLQQNNFLELLPVWLQVVCQGLRSGLASRLSDALKAALDLLSEISEQDPNIELLRAGWRQVMGAIAGLDPNAALMLLSDKAWTQFTRLGIAHMPIDSPEKFIAQYAVAQNQPKPKSQSKRRNASNKPPRSKK